MTYNQRYYEKNKEREKERSRKYREANLEKARQSTRNWQQTSKKARESVRLHNWKKQGIDISWERYEELLLQQNNRCKICRSLPTGRWKSLDVDHDHVTGKVRGLLCNSCNRALGLFKDSPLLLEQALKYLVE